VSSLLAGGLLGLVLGVRHSFEPDHLAAVATFVARVDHPRRAVAVGALWGAGHAAGLLVLGAIVLAFRANMPGWLDDVLEMLVGVMLITLGVRAIRLARAPRDPSDDTHTGSRLAPFAVGLGHGTAGTGAAVLLASATMQQPHHGVLFLGLFGAGSIAAMALIAGTLSLSVQDSTVARRRHRTVLGAAGLLSAAIGVWWMFRAGMQLLVA